MANLPVKWFSSDQGGAPVLGDETAGDFNALLKACLITGYNINTVLEATYDAGTDRARLTFSTAHGYLKHQVIDVSGADQGGYNGQFRVTAIGADWIEYQPDTAPATSPATTATQIESKAAPQGEWEIVDEDVSNYHLVFRSTDPAAPPHTYMVTNDGSNFGSEFGNIATVRILESYTDPVTFDQAAEEYWPASNSRSRLKDWTLIVDSQALYFMPTYTDFDRASCLVLGAINSIRPGDAGHSIINGINGTNQDWQYNRYTMTDFASLGSNYRRQIARAYHQLPGAVDWTMHGIDGEMGMSFGYPNPASNGFFVATGKILVKESSSLRGYMPGLLQPLQTDDVYHRTIIDVLPGLDGIPVYLQKVKDNREPLSGSYNLIAFRLDDWGRA